MADANKKAVIKSELDTSLLDLNKFWFGSGQSTYTGSTQYFSGTTYYNWLITPSDMLIMHIKLDGSFTPSGLFTCSVCGYSHVNTALTQCPNCKQSGTFSTNTAFQVHPFSFSIDPSNERYSFSQGGTQFLKSATNAPTKYLIQEKPSVPPTFQHEPLLTYTGRQVSGSNNIYFGSSSMNFTGTTKGSIFIDDVFCVNLSPYVQV